MEDDAQPPVGGHAGVVEDVRLQKVLARVGYGSRRVCDDLIAAGRVLVNGEVAVLGRRVDPETALIEVDGAPIGVRPGLVHYLLNKPAGVVTTADDPRGRPTVVGLVPAEPRVFPVGRLDADTEGLLLLTNDGEFCQKVAHPSHGLLKTYRVTVAKRLELETLKQLTLGLRDKGEFLKARRARLLSTNNTRSEAELVLAEGRNREVRRMFKALGFRVLRLQRVAVGPVKLGELPPGKWRVLSRAEIASCLKPPGK